MKIAVYNQQNDKVKDITLSPNFDIKVSSEAVTLYINYLRAALRSPIANTKDRGDVSGGGRKPYKQKGTGNARAGSTRSPLWVGGGVTFGPTNDRNFRIRINSKEKKRVIFGILADLIRDTKVKVIDDLTLAKIKTKNAASILESIQAEGKTSVIIESSDVNTILSFRNIAGVFVMTPNKLDVINLMSSNTVIVSEKALARFEEVYAPKKVAKTSEKIEEPKEEKVENKETKQEKPKTEKVEKPKAAPKAKKTVNKE